MEKSCQSKDSVSVYAVQCGKCMKWRVVPTKDEYETIRESFAEDPWYCDKRSGVSCDDPGDIEYDNSRLWVIDKPNIPKTPPDVERKLIMRRDFSKMDAHYIMPNGKRVRSPQEVEKFLDAHPQYKDKYSVSSFVFTVPKVMEDMVPKNREGNASASNSKRLKTASRMDD